MRNLKEIKNIVVKIGSTSLCDSKGNLSDERILTFISQIVKIKRKGINVVIVSSGAINAGMLQLSLDSKPTKLSDKQALAAIGQARLMQIYEDLFKLYHINVAQILLTHDDFDNRKRLMNLANSLKSIMDYGVVPIINENDPLAVEEIKVGDNDTLASLIVPIVDADLLILVSDIDGLYDDNPNTNKDAKLISNVKSITSKIRSFAKDSNNNVGTGGMVTKLRAAKIVNDYGCDMAIVNGSYQNILLDLLAGKEVGTYFDGKSGITLSSRDHWIMYRSKPKGKVIIDDGARNALMKKHTSLLPKGIIDVDGKFMAGSIVDIVDKDDNLLARGIVNYSSSEVELIKGLKTSQIEDVLHFKDYDEVIHADNLVLRKDN
ncbi:MAG: glutamate 5-kinase [Thomasclavelia sp.]|nr:glutamate 5-kinase [Thomasclavelia sp.]